MSRCQTPLPPWTKWLEKCSISDVAVFRIKDGASWILSRSFCEAACSESNVVQLSCASRGTALVGPLDSDRQAIGKTVIHSVFLGQAGISWDHFCSAWRKRSLYVCGGELDDVFQSYSVCLHNPHVQFTCFPYQEKGKEKKMVKKNAFSWLHNNKEWQRTCCHKMYICKVEYILHVYFMILEGSWK